MVTMAETRRITVKIAGKEFAMIIPAHEEEIYRRAAADINQLVSAYKASFVAEPEDYLAMAAIQTAVLKVDLERKREMSDQAEALEKIESKIDSYLNSFRTDSF